MKKSFSILFFSIVFLSFSMAQKVTIELDKDSVLIGEHIKLSIVAESQYKATFILPDTNNLGFFEYIETTKYDTTDFGLNAEWLITCFDSGYYSFGPIPMLFVSENKQKIDTVFSNTFIIYVNTVEVNLEEDFKPIKEQKNIAFPWKEVLIKVLIVVAILSLILFAIFYYIKRKKRLLELANKPKTPLEIYIETLQKLETLESQKLWQKDQIKEYYFTLSETLRNYIEGRFKVNAMELTTDEIFELMNAEINDGLNKKLKEILSQADLAKYAKFKPANEENVKIMKLSKDFVLHTKPKLEKDEVVG
jgi:hypothetical protein